ncbi:MAG: electron transport complex subunit RsxB [bacterium]
MISAILTMTLLALALGVILVVVAHKFKVEGTPIVEEIVNVLPQTQCGQCGFPGCRPYAEAITGEEAPINRCPPGGEAGIQKLADLLGKEIIPLDEEVGEEKPPEVAIIIEADCIGCTKCIQACPIDAILGAAKQMHTVIKKECTGCELCVEPCPVDCIIMVPLKTEISTWLWPEPKPLKSESTEQEAA